MYGSFMQEHNGAPPKDEAEFKSFLAKYAAKRLKPYNVDSVDELLISPRDEQPFVVVYGKKLGFQGFAQHAVGGLRADGRRRQAAGRPGPRRPGGVLAGRVFS